MIVYYDLKEETWFHQNDRLNSYKIGFNEEVHYSRRQSFNDCLPFRVTISGNRVGPIIGLLVSKKKEKFLGNIPLFKRIQRELFKVGGVCIVYPIDDLLEGKRIGYCYLPHINHWIKVNNLLPDILYNRILRKDEQQNKLKLLLAELPIPTFNQHFFDKWDVHSYLNENETIKKYLPQTDIFSENAFYQYVQQFRTFYIKKRDGSKGNGIFYIKKTEKKIIVSSVTNEYIFSTPSEAFRFLQQIGPSIIQQEVPALLWKKNKFDLRVFVHYVGNHYEISGIGVRVADTQQVTTHVPNGGKIANYEELPYQINRPLLQSLLNKCGHQLSTKTSFIGEFSADIGIDPTCHYYIYELNAKPMEFDEPMIKQTGTKNLVKTFYYLANFTWRKKTNRVEI